MAFIYYFTVMVAREGGELLYRLVINVFYLFCLYLAWAWVFPIYNIESDFIPYF